MLVNVSKCYQTIVNISIRW